MFLSHFLRHPYFDPFYSQIRLATIGKTLSIHSKANVIQKSTTIALELITQRPVW